MGTYNIPRDVKGEGRILFIFSKKGLIFTVAGAAIGSLFYFLFSILGLRILGIIITVLFAIIGFVIGTLKMPEIGSFKVTKQTAGENIDDVIKRAFKFYRNKRRIYIYKEEETKDEQ